MNFQHVGYPMGTTRVHALGLQLKSGKFPHMYCGPANAL